MSETKGPPPDWAVQQATDELGDVDPAEIERRARKIARRLHRERHDEYDDPDEGGEA